MPNPLDALPPCTVIAHRGASRERPENTLEAIRLALEEGAHAVEIDLKRTADGVVVLMHDATVKRTTGVAGTLHRMTYREVAALDAGRGFHPYPGRHSVPRLEEVLETVARRTWLNLELTNYPTPLDDLPERVAGILLAAGYLQKVWVSSFNPVALWRFRRALPRVPLGFLVGGRGGLTLTRGLWIRLLRAEAVHPHWGHLSRSWWRRWQKRGLQVFVYTINEPRAMAAAFRAGVDGIFTDVPQRALEVRARICTSASPHAMGAPNSLSPSG